MPEYFAQTTLGGVPVSDVTRDFPRSITADSELMRMCQAATAPYLKHVLQAAIKDADEVSVERLLPLLSIDVLGRDVLVSAVESKNPVGRGEKKPAAAMLFGDAHHVVANTETRTDEQLLAARLKIAIAMIDRCATIGTLAKCIAEEEALVALAQSNGKLKLGFYESFTRLHYKNVDIVEIAVHLLQSGLKPLPDVKPLHDSKDEVDEGRPRWSVTPFCGSGVHVNVMTAILLRMDPKDSASQVNAVVSCHYEPPRSDLFAKPDDPTPFSIPLPAPVEVPLVIATAGDEALFDVLIRFGADVEPDPTRFPLLSCWYRNVRTQLLDSRNRSTIDAKRKWSQEHMPERVPGQFLQQPPTPPDNVGEAEAAAASNEILIATAKVLSKLLSVGAVPLSRQRFLECLECDAPFLRRGFSGIEYTMRTKAKRVEDETPRPTFGQPEGASETVLAQQAVLESRLLDVFVDPAFDTPIA